METRVERSGFSLVEVVIAVAIFATAIVSVLWLLPVLARQTSDSADRMIAQGLPDAVRSEIKRLAGGGLEGFAAQVPVMTTAATEGYRMAGARDGVRLTSLSAPDGVLAEDESYFLIELWRFDSAPLAFQGERSGALPIFVRVSWPFSTAGATGANALEAREQFTFAVAINR